MHDDDHALAAWGRGVAEEALLQAALQLPADPDPATGAGCALAFRIVADGPGRQLELRCPRVGGDDLVLRIDLPSSEDG